MPQSIRDAPHDPRRATVRKRSRVADWAATIPILLLIPALVLPVIATRAADASLTVSGTPVAGTPFTITGSGFPGREWFQLTWDGSPDGMVAIRATRDGQFSASVTPVADGSHVIAAALTVKGSSPRKADSLGTPIATVSVDVLPASSTSPAPTATPAPSPTAEPTASPAPSATAEPTASPAPSPTAEPTASPAPSPTPDPSASMDPSPTPSPTATPSPSASDSPPIQGPIPWPSSSAFHYGVLDQWGLIGSSSSFATWIDSVRQHGMNDGFIYNDNPDLSVSDSLGFNVVTSPMFQMYRDWYYFENYHGGQRLCGGTITMSCAEAQIGPIVDALKGHPSLVGYNTIDDANDSLRVRIWYANQVFSNHDTAHAEGPTIPDNWPSVYDYTRPDAFIHYDYPAATGYAACDFNIGRAQDWVDRFRYTTQMRPASVPVWEILQAHGWPGTTGTLRYPTPEELRLNYWLALGEGVKGLYWFTWSTNTNAADNEPWIGLRDNANLLPEATALAGRMGSLAPIFAKLSKISDAFQVSPVDRAYVSTLKDPGTGKLYVVAANHSCAAQTLTLSSWEYSAGLRDVETGQTYTLPASLSFRGGDGRLFEVLSPRAITPPSPQQNVAVNNSFESGTTWPTNWSAGNSAVSWDATVAHTGTRSLRATGPATWSYLSQTTALKPNTKYYVSFWMKGDALVDSYVGVRYVDLSQALPARVAVEWNHNGTFAWRKHVGFFRTSANPSGERLDITWRINGGGTGWIDDVVLCDTTKPCPDPYLGERG